MLKKKTHKAILGAQVMVLFSSLGFIISLFNFFITSSPISYTGGAELVMCSTFAIAVLSVLICFFRHIKAKLERVSLYVLILLLILGTLLAAWFLESYALLVAMVVVLIAWLVQVFIN